MRCLAACLDGGPSVAGDATGRWYFFPDDGEGGCRLLAERVGVELREGDAVDIGGRPAIALGRAKNLGGGFKRLFTARIGGEDAGCEVAVLAYDNPTYSEGALAEWRDKEFGMLVAAHGATPGCCPEPYVTGTVSRGDAMDKRSPAIAEQSLAGSTLEQIVERNRTPGGIGVDMDSRTSASYALAVANVLKRLRGEGAGTVFVHRDIKPANIHIGPSGEAVLLDWQTAVEDHLDETANISSVPSPSTRAFTAPERDPGGPLWAKDDRGTWGASQDIYSLGITMVYLRAFHQLGGRLGRTHYSHRLGEGLDLEVPLTELGFDLLGLLEDPNEQDKELARIVGRCTEVFPEYRIGLDDLIKELRKLQGAGDGGGSTRLADASGNRRSGSAYKDSPIVVIRDENLIKRLNIFLDESESKLEKLLSEPFFGRNSLAEQVARWLDGSDSPQVCLITGGIGVGKSAFAAHLSHLSCELFGRVAASYFCMSGMQFLNDPRTVVRSLAYLLAQSIPQYRIQLNVMLDRGVDLDADASSLFLLLIASPLKNTFPNGHESMLIAIDGIDEAGSVTSNPLADTIASCSRSLPEWMKVLATSRHVSAVTAAFSGAETIELSGETDEGIADVRAFFEARLGESFANDPGYAQSIGRLAQASGGIFLYARLLADAVIKGRVSLADAASAYPKDLSGQIFQWFRWAFPDISEYKRDYRDALGCIMAAPWGSLPIAELPVLFGWNCNETNEFLRRVEIFLTPTTDMFDADAVMLSHAFLSQWLSGKNAGEYGSTAEDALALIARRYFGRAMDEPDGLTDYEAVSILDALSASGLSDEYEKLWKSETVAWRIVDVAYSLFDIKKRYAHALEILLRLEDHLRRQDCISEGLAISVYSNLGLLYDRTGRPDKAEEAFLTSLSIVDGLSEQNRSEHLPAKAMTLYNLGSLLFSTGRLDEAEDVLRESLSIRQDLEKSGSCLPSSVARTRNLLGNTLRRLEKEREAESLLRESLLADNPAADPEWPACIADTYFILGHHYRDTGHLEEASESYREALSILRDAPIDDLEKSEGEAMMLDARGIVLGKLGKLDDAELAYTQAIMILNGLDRSVRPHARMAEIYNNLGFLLSSSGRKKEAVEAHLSAIEIARELAVPDPRALPGLATMVFNYCSLLEEIGRVEDAVDTYLQNIAFMRKVAGSDSAFTPPLALTLRALADLLEKIGRFREAMDVRREEVSIMRELAASDQNYLSVIVVSLYDLGILEMATRSLDEAVGSFRDSIEILIELSESDARYYPFIAQTYDTLCIVLEMKGMHNEAEEMRRMAASYERKNKRARHRGKSSSRM